MPKFIIVFTLLSCLVISQTTLGQLPRPSYTTQEIAKLCWEDRLDKLMDIVLDERSSVNMPEVRQILCRWQRHENIQQWVTGTGSVLLIAAAFTLGHWGSDPEQHHEAKFAALGLGLTGIIKYIYTTAQDHCLVLEHNVAVLEGAPSLNRFLNAIQPQRPVATRQNFISRTMQMLRQRTGHFSNRQGNHSGA